MKYLKTRAIAATAVALLAFAGVAYGSGQARAAQPSRVATPPGDITVKIDSWDGYCVSIPTASVGVRLDQVPCSSAHGWWIDPSGDVYPEGHTNVQVGDSGGYLELKAAGTGTPYSSDDTEVGPNGATYFDMEFGVPNTYWHADGNGLDMTLDGVFGDHANYYIFLSAS